MRGSVAAAGRESTARPLLADRRGYHAPVPVPRHPAHPSTDDPDHPDTTPTASTSAPGILAVAFPGLGHLSRGKPGAGFSPGGRARDVLRRAAHRGIDTVDSREDKWWFYGQAFVGPIVFAVDWAHQNQFKAYAVPAEPDMSTGTTVFRTSERALLAEHRLRSVFPAETRKVVEVSVIPSSGGTPVARRCRSPSPPGRARGRPMSKAWRR